MTDETVFSLNMTYNNKRIKFKLLVSSKDNDKVLSDSLRQFLLAELLLLHIVYCLTPQHSPSPPFCEIFINLTEYCSGLLIEAGLSRDWSIYYTVC